MENDNQWQKIVKFTTFLILLIAIIFILKTLKGIFVPLVLSIFLAYLFAPVIEFFAKFKVPRLVTLFILLSIICIIGVFFAQIIISNIKDFINIWPSLEKKLLTSAGNFFKDYLKINSEDLFKFIQSPKVTEFLSSFLNISFTVIGKILLTVLMLIFIYLSYHNYPRLIKKAFNEKKALYIFNILKNVNDQIIQYLIIKTLISAGTGILTGVACGILKIKFAVLWGFLAFLLNYIPYIGSIIAIIFPIFLSFIQFPHSFIPFVTAIILIIIQLFIGSFLDPEIMGNRFNLSPIVILISLFFWSYVWGTVGAFLAVPITAIIKIIILNIESLKFIAVLISKKAE